MDVFNDQWGIETDTQGVFFLGANPALTAVASFVNAGIPSLGSFFDPRHQDHSARLKAFKSSGYREGKVNYTYELALQIEGWGDAWQHRLANGTQVGLEIAIADQGQSLTWLSRTRRDAGREGNSNLPNAERVRNRDWGVVQLAGWNGRAAFAFSSWPADEDIRFWNSQGNPGGGDRQPGVDRALPGADGRCEEPLPGAASRRFAGAQACRRARGGCSLRRPALGRPLSGSA